ncbi:MAG: maleylpyruvate isomerase family mycothiol-dependent enzyme [Acidimicrobiia bacterium]
MDFAAYLDALDRESGAFARAARATPLDAAVPTCPEWSVENLVRHLGRVHRWAARCVRERATDRVRSGDPGPEAVRLLDWFDEGAAELAEVLRAAGPGAAVWTWGPGGTSGWWARRQAHETAIHRFDAESAAGGGAPIDSEQAVDLVDELLDNLDALLGFGSRSALGGRGETLHLHCTDADGEWLLTLEGDGFAVARTHAKGDVAARGTASDLALFVTGRVGAERLEIFGDAALLERWQAFVRF